VIATDSSSLIAFFEGDQAADTALVKLALANQTLCLPPPVVSELLSAHETDPVLEELLQIAPLIDLAPDFWRRAGDLRRSILRQGYKARLPDALVARCCIDSDIALITRDRAFRHFAAAGLRLAT
jgi:predicted nucleic acid-binding protein